ncbi:TetR/AcrR family transcriptional regulator C-terminal domain-containing protein [Streptomyces sp. NPDC056390]|uniref:TetR/AcrR family transcriptional regulator C-terminal domain-containing protein n=1 Tax=Streptomyces sp. NPDC056390 TaxID=3345806 RepID=UPI0035D88EBF
MADAVRAEIRLAGDGWRAVLRSLAESIRQASHRHEWLADLLGERPRLGPNMLAGGEAVPAAMGDIDLDTVVPAVSRSMST